MCSTYTTRELAVSDRQVIPSCFVSILSSGHYSSYNTLCFVLLSATITTSFFVLISENIYLSIDII